MALVCEWQSLGGVVLHSVLLRSAPKAGTRKTAFLERMLPAKAKHERDLQVVAS